MARRAATSGVLGGGERRRRSTQYVADAPVAGSLPAFHSRRGRAHCRVAATACRCAPSRWVASLAGLVAAGILAGAVYGMPLNHLFASIAYGAAFGLFPIGWVVFTAILLYRVTVESGKFEILKDSIANLTTDRRLQALLIAFAFGAFIEGAAGFGTPVAVAGAMLAGAGFTPFYAAAICLLANTAPVAFGRSPCLSLLSPSPRDCRSTVSARASGASARRCRFSYPPI